MPKLTPQELLEARKRKKEEAAHLQQQHLEQERRDEQAVIAKQQLEEAERALREATRQDVRKRYNVLDTSLASLYGEIDK